MNELLPVEIITIGDELLLGQVLDSNSAWLGQQLALHGAEVKYISTVGDRAADIRSAVDQAGKRARLVLLTGGLGPTRDDITKAVLVDYFGGELRLDHDILADVQQRFRGKQMPAVNLKQAEVPSSCRPLRNHWGTAPAMWFQRNGVDYLSMPGVPYEMRGVVTAYLLPWLAQRNTLLYHRSVIVVNHGESQLMEKIRQWEDGLAPFSLAYLPSPAMIRLRLSCAARKGDDTARMAEEKIAQLRAILGTDLMSDPGQQLEQLIFTQLKERSLTLSVAESCSGGHLSHLLSRWEGSSAVFRGGLVCYSPESKVALLGISSEYIAEHGTVNQHVAQQMAEGVRRRFNSDLSVATTGLLTSAPAGEHAAPGTVWLAASDGSQTLCTQHKLRGDDRARNIKRVSVQALLLLRQLLSQR